MKIITPLNRLLHTALSAFAADRPETSSPRSVPKQFPTHEWTGTWATTIQEIEGLWLPPPPGLANITVRQIVRVSIGGKQLRVRFSNAFGSSAEGLTINEAQVAAFAGGSSIQPGTSRLLTFSGKPLVRIPPGALMISDPIDCALAPGSDLAITIHVNETSNKISGHRASRGKTTYLHAGNVVSAVELPLGISIDAWYFLSGIDVLAPANAAAIVCMGDSITDGKGSTEGTNGRWPDFLARRLQANKSTANIGVLNASAGGNRVWCGGLGQTALVRIARDVLAQPGAKWLILFEGISDLCGGTTRADQVIAGLEQITMQAKDRRLIVYGATFFPCGGSRYFNAEMERKRLKINSWIRTGGAYDAVMDFDIVLRDPIDPTRLIDMADCGDHMHLNDLGCKMLADSIDLKLFAK